MVILISIMKNSKQQMEFQSKINFNKLAYLFRVKRNENWMLDLKCTHFKTNLLNL